MRRLAGQVQSATEEITQNINTMIQLVETTSGETRQIGREIGGAQAAMNGAARSFDKMVADFEESGGQLLKIAAAVEELTAANEQVHNQVSEIRQMSATVAQQMAEAQQTSRGLSGTTEAMQEMVARFKVGRGRFERILLQARELRDHCQQQLVQMQRQGLDIFDRQYQEVAGTDPKKFRTRYDEVFEQALQVRFDQTLDALPGAIYVLAVDVNGYLPAHHRRFSHPPTGKREVDLIHSRQKRIYNASETEIRRARNTQNFLLQTYLRDTGEMLNDLSLPIFIDGQHWGAIIVGLQPQVLLEE